MTEKVGYLGPEGTFTEFAAKTMFPSHPLVPFRTIPDCIEAVIDQTVDFGIVPIENTIEGSVNLTVDYLFEQENMSIVAEITIPIRQHLMVHPDHSSVWDTITAIYSHPQALAQSHRYLRKRFPNIELHQTTSTAMAAKLVQERSDERIAAIGNDFAAETYGLTIVERDIHDFQNNHTKFVVLSQRNASFAKNGRYRGDKTTFMITLPSDYPGALHQVLSAFAWRKLNLSKIESRPLKTGLGNYFFIIDVQMKADHVLIDGVKEELEALGCGVDMIGSYPCFFVE